ncbi:hypothetical protein E8E11_001913 [Didymella keratinophila]|nr:hypothetical protein E8E11_001913 [Didymella keratinophila]
MTLPNAAVQALRDLQTYAKTINVPDTRAEVDEALRYLANQNHALEFDKRNLYLKGVHIGLEHEKKVKKLVADVERERKEKQQALDTRDSLLEVVKELKTALEAERRKSLEEQQPGEVQEGQQQLRIEEE